MFQRRKKVVLITGASSGIGEALAREYVKLNFNVVLFARRKDRLKILSEQLRKQNPEVAIKVCVGDVTQKADLEQAIRVVKNCFGRLDVLIANAGFAVSGSFEDLTIDDYRRQFETNVFGVLNTCYIGLDELKKTKGRLAVIGSVNSYVTIPGGSAYSMSKFAVKALANSLSLELSPAGVSTTLVCPGFVDTEIFQIDNYGSFQRTSVNAPPKNFTMQVDLAAQKICQGIKERRREIVITGHGKVAVWAQRYFPGAVAFAIEKSKKVLPQRGLFQTKASP